MICFVLFISVFYAVGFWLLGCSVWGALKSSRAANWPTVPGTIKQLSIHENRDDESTSYEVKVQYAYEVDGVEYEGDRIAFGYGGSSGRLSHEEIHRKLEAAKHVAVRYDPADPAASCLSFGMHRSLQLTLTFAITWLAFVSGCTILWWLFEQRETVLLDNLKVD